jgi:hypothetical protein
MRIHTLSLKGLLAFREPVTLDCATLPDQGIIAITGSNGAGKTTFLESLGVAPLSACAYAAHHFYSTTFADGSLAPTLAGSAALAPGTGLQAFGDGGLTLTAPLGGVGWTVALNLGLSAVAQNQTVLSMNGLELIVRNRTFIFG